jgi:hypothetical protein
MNAVKMVFGFADGKRQIKWIADQVDLNQADRHRIFYPSANFFR